jgi:hypothetical protein
MGCAFSSSRLKKQEEKGRGTNDFDTYTKNNKYVIKISILSESSSKYSAGTETSNLVESSKIT